LWLVPLAASGPGTFGELDTAGARSVLRRYSGAWFATAEPGRTCQVCTRHDVTPGDGPHHGHPPTVPWPAPNGNHRTGSRSPHREEPASRRLTSGELTDRCTKAVTLPPS
jgi:hypothetical protein